MNNFFSHLFKHLLCQGRNWMRRVGGAGSITQTLRLPWRIRSLVICVVIRIRKKYGVTTKHVDVWDSDCPSSYLRTAIYYLCDVQHNSNSHEFQFSHLKNENNNRPCFLGLLWLLKELYILAIKGNILISCSVCSHLDYFPIRSYLCLRWHREE